jgi:hypothetical protein
MGWKPNQEIAPKSFETNVFDPLSLISLPHSRNQIEYATVISHLATRPESRPGALEHLSLNSGLLMG